jgi:hypothetical protein
MDPAVMLTLAALTYRGCDLNLSDPMSRVLAIRDVSQCLAKCRALRGDWEIAWGPAGFRSGAIGVDDVALYVFQNHNEPNSLGIAIRGTNFFSLRDWFSNLSIDQLPWPYDRSSPPSEVRVSRSVSTQLRIVQSLRSAPSSLPLGDVGFWSAARAWTAGRQAALGYSLLKVLEHGSGIVTSSLSAAMSSAISDAIDFHFSTSLDSIDDQIRTAISKQDLPNINPGDLLDVVDVEQQRIGEGVDLLGFLRAFTAKAKGPIDLYICGHSKGGAIVPAVALWLADTQGDDREEANVWDPDSKVSIHTFSFAAPTAGNGAFRDYFSKRPIRAYRLANPMDVVPHAWNARELDQIPSLYNGELAPLKGLTDVVIEEVKRLDYQHESPTAEWLNAQPEDLGVTQQIAFQHLDAYLRHFDLLGEMSLDSLFAPIS